ncbi:MAG TPA: DUF5667 domain-containing protein [Pseudonocardiaceae bacterium]
MSVGRTSAGRHRTERFARAVDLPPGRSADEPPDQSGTESDTSKSGTSKSGTSKSGTEQPARPDDLADDLAVVTTLRRAGAEVRAGTAIDPETRTRVRAIVLAAAEKSAAEAARVEAAKASAAMAGRHAAGRHRKAPSRRGKVLIALAAVACVVLALAGMTFLISRHALPGQALYPVKRTVEAAALDLTLGDEAKGLKHLQYATDRVTDVETMLGASSGTVGDYQSALADFDADATAGSTTLTVFGADNNPQALDALRDWSGTQAGRLLLDRTMLPVSDRSAANDSIALANRIRQRAIDLLARTSCFTVTSSSADDIGALPATGPCDGKPSAASASPVSGTPASSPPSTSTSSRAGQPGAQSAPITGTPTTTPTPGNPLNLNSLLNIPATTPTTGSPTPRAPATQGGAPTTTTTPGGLTLRLPLIPLTISLPPLRLLGG